MPTKLGIHPDDARTIVYGLTDGEAATTTPALVTDAVDMSIVTKHSIWDCMIIQAAIQGRCGRILTEDLSHGQTIKAVRIENPFRVP